MSVKVLVGDALATLRTLPDESVHCCVTSPPYWGLRSYEGGERMIGLESTFEEHLERLVAVFREVRRVLRSDGTFWLNYGDAYAQSSSACKPDPNADRYEGGGVGSWGTRKTNSAQATAKQIGLKAKNLMMMPARVALALQADGWWVRSEIVWHKPNPMPESCTDRPTSAHEKLFLLTKSGSPLFWTHRGQDGVRSVPEPDYVWRNRDTGAETASEPDGWRELLSERSTPKQPVKLWRRVNLWGGHDYFYDAEAVRVPLAASSTAQYRQPYTGTNGKSYDGTGAQDGRDIKRRMTTSEPSGADLRNVWTIATESFPGAHFATFPPKLVEPCIKAGTSEHGCCAQCRAPWVREVAVRQEVTGGMCRHSDGSEVESGWTGFPVTRRSSETTGWSPSCDCLAEYPHLRRIPCTVLDPFGGAGTVGVVAQSLGRDAILIEISERYAAMARDRIERPHRPKMRPSRDAKPLFEAAL